MSSISRLLNVFRSDRVDDELDDELRFHLEQKTNALIDAGMTPEAARLEARRRLGNPMAAHERSRDVKLLGWLDALFKDVRFGLRMLRKDFVVASAAVLSLSLAMGACIAAFALIDALILRPLPVQDPRQLVFLTYERFDEATGAVDAEEGASFSYPLFERLRSSGRSRVDLFAVSYQGPQPVRFDDSGGVDEKVMPQYVSGDTFDRLGLTPAIGRLLAGWDDLRPGAHPVAVLSHSFWMRRFGGNRGVVGRWFTLDRKSFQIVGVSAAGFSGVEPGIRTDIWIPMMMGNPEALRESGGNGSASWDECAKASGMTMRALSCSRCSPPFVRSASASSAATNPHSFGNGTCARRFSCDRPPPVLPLSEPRSSVRCGSLARSSAWCCSSHARTSRTS
jgi:putative ABC transport system permease protein